MYILGISAFYHDSSAVLLRDGEVAAAAHEERFTRKKHDPSFPANAVEYCLKEGAVSFKDLEAVAFYDKPFLKFERLLETYYAFAPKGLGSFISAMPVWIKDKLLLKKLILKELSSLRDFDAEGIKILFPEHHLSHAGSAFYPSPYGESAILTVDGVGEWATASICRGKGKDITILRELRFPHSLGLLYSAFTYYLGFKVNSGEYKLMGLAPYGDPGSKQTEEFIKIIKTRLVNVKADGSIWLDQEYFDYAAGLKMVNEAEWEKLFGFPVRGPGGEMRREHCNLALAIQKVTEEIILKMAEEARRLTGSANLCLAGGVALNCVANGRLRESGLFENIWIQPAAGDAGGALGAAYCAYHIYLGKDRAASDGADKMRGSYLGPRFSDPEIRVTAERRKAVYEHFEEFGLLCDKVSRLLAEGNVIGWFQGRMEWGPRALGNRSIIADARNPEMQKKLNLNIKLREGFRPFAPSVLYEDVAEYFDAGAPSPYMLLTAGVLEKRRRPLPPGYHALNWREKLYHPRSDIPAVTHIDFTARLQTVHKDTNPRYWRLIDDFKKKTGYGVIVNTSFNIRGEPIVCAPDDAYKCFMRTGMDYLVLGDNLFDKKRQPPLEEVSDWRRDYAMD